MADVYESVYKCRMCGDRVLKTTSVRNYSRASSEKFIQSVVDDTDWVNIVGVPLKTGHECSGGGLGVADFCGYECIKTREEGVDDPVEEVRKRSKKPSSIKGGRIPLGSS